ncbi:MAG: class I adenylate-forming enzyme family protein, partial [Pseudomonadota bacterium]
MSMRDQVLRPWAHPLDSAGTLPHLVQAHAQATPDQLAFTSIGQGSLTWHTLWEQSRRWAGWLSAAGVARGDRVVTLVPQSLESPLAWMGCSLLGAVDVSVNTDFKGEWLRNALTVSAARHVVLARRFLDALLPVLPGSGIEHLLGDDGVFVFEVH